MKISLKEPDVVRQALIALIGNRTPTLHSISDAAVSKWESKVKFSSCFLRKRQIGKGQWKIEIVAEDDCSTANLLNAVGILYKAGAPLYLADPENICHCYIAKLKKTTSIMIIIPDIHGRDFWEKPVKENHGKEHIVFLGDYLDPYEYEGIAPWEVFPRFEDIVALKKENPDGVTLLLGNHDLQYLDGDLGGSRYDRIHGARNKKFILDNLNLFQMAYEVEVAGKKYLFSHAGVMWGWLIANRHLLGTIMPPDACEKLNGFLQDRETWPRFFTALSDVSHARWGPCRHGSMIWSDVDDWEDKFYELTDIYQIFGHSQQETDPVIGKHFACLDCRRAFRMNEDGITEYR